MRTVRTKVYSFEELSQEAKQVAIENYRNSRALDDVGYWAVDDCALFEPIEKDLIELFGKDYNFPLIKNTRKNIYFDTDRNSFLDCQEAIEVTNDKQFLLWLGIDVNEEGLKDICYSFYTSNYRNVGTTIDFDNYSSDFDSTVLDAQSKFNNYIQDVLKRIEKAIDYRYSDEVITEDILVNEYEFLSNGKRF
jgi:hypothetical protein